MFTLMQYIANKPTKTRFVFNLFHLFAFKFLLNTKSEKSFQIYNLCDGTKVSGEFLSLNVELCPLQLFSIQFY
jgi:hypothetical protein